MRLDSDGQEEIAIQIGTRRAPALPLQSQCVPSVTPAGMVTSSVRRACTTPLPPQGVHSSGRANHARLALLLLARDHPGAAAGGAFVLGDEIEPPFARP